MRVMGQRLPPGVEDSEEAEFAAEMPGIGGNGLERLGGRLEQHRIELPLVLIGDRGDLGRHGEHHMGVRYRQQIGLTVGKPAIARGTRGPSSRCVGMHSFAHSMV